MTPPEFTLQPTNVPQPTLLDEEITTHDWPLPAAKAWEPAPRPSLFWQIVEAMS